MSDKDKIEVYISSKGSYLLNKEIYVNDNENITFYLKNSCDEDLDYRVLGLVEDKYKDVVMNEEKGWQHCKRHIIECI